MKGTFITFEGGEGAGKSTLAKNVFEKLKSEGKDVIFTREPGGTKFGEEIRALLLSKNGFKIGPRAELFLFLAARAQHVEEVLHPALEAGKIVICDRFTDSTIAYQGIGRGLGVGYVSNCAMLATMEVSPDATFIVDIDPVIGLARVGKRTSGAAVDRIEDEGLQFHNTIRQAFRKLAEASPNRITLLDGTLSESKLLELVMERIKGLLK
jgi:dTMP kinase